MHFPFHLIIRCLASTFNVLTSMSMAIDHEGRIPWRLSELGSFPTIGFACAVEAW
jgi:hypothetical protein